MTPFDDDPAAVPAACRPAVDRLQTRLDDRRPPADLLADAHVRGCPDCRDRVRAACVIADLLAVPVETFAVPSGFADAVAAGALADRRRRLRVRVFARAAGGFAVAAGVLVAVGVWWNRPPAEVVKHAPRPAPTPARETAPAPRLGDEFAAAGDALRSLTAKAAEPPLSAPKGFPPLAGVFTAPPPAPRLEPAAHSLSALPDAARSSFEPVTASAFRAFSRLLEDVSAVHPGEKPKS